MVHVKIYCCCTYPHAKVVLKDSGVGKYYVWADLWAVYLVIRWMEKWPKVKIHVDPSAVADSLADWSGARQD